jgi:hypothetical protein
MLPIEAVYTTLSGETTGGFLTRELSDLGATLTLPLTGTSGYDAKVTPAFVGGAVELAAETPREDELSRKAYFLTLELIGEFTRTISHSPAAASTADLGVTDSTQSLTTDPTSVEEIAPSSTEDDVSEPTEPQVSTANKPANSSDTESLDAPKKEDSTTELADAAKEAEKKELVREASTTVFMVPRLCGIRPLDFVLVPNIQRDWLEDWMVDSVTYTQQGSAILVDLTLRRWSKDEPMLTNYETLITKMSSIGPWLNYHWVL